MPGPPFLRVPVGVETLTPSPSPIAMGEGR